MIKKNSNRQRVNKENKEVKKTMKIIGKDKDELKRKTSAYKEKRQFFYS